ncbi:uncharacterized protein RAG0_06263 [Rhynchosporium agropyri]|uniref:Uncharacterized protein n=1 Tax=Rhynchosporium agropyri TaxID=914238 RepID=A0A1E1KGE5_9HELO|nr:uncharacterized protein RAG0_06263 [Rhynchosporium agropyri]
MKLWLGHPIHTGYKSGLYCPYHELARYSRPSERISQGIAPTVWTSPPYTHDQMPSTLKT